MTQEPPSRRGRIWRFLAAAAALVLAVLTISHFLTSHADSPFEGAPGAYGSGTLFVLAALATWLSEDLTCIGAGIAVGADRMGFELACAACFTGIVVSDIGLYFIGRWIGPAALHARPLRWIVKEADVMRTERWMRERSVWVIALARLLPAVRVPVYFAAGMLGVPPAKFVITLTVTVAVYAVALVGVSTWAGEWLQDHFHRYDLIAAIVIGIVALVLLVRFATKRLRAP